MTLAEAKKIADNARREASNALTAWKAASRDSWARGESCDYLRAADDAAHRAYIAAAERRAVAEYNEDAIERGWPLR